MSFEPIVSAGADSYWWQKKAGGHIARGSVQDMRVAAMNGAVAFGATYGKIDMEFDALRWKFEGDHDWREVRG